MSLRHTLLLVILPYVVFTGGAVAQTVAGPLVDVQIIGASETNERLIRVNLVARPGTPAERIDLEAERNRLLAMGTFAEVSLSLEDRGRGPILVVRVRENPTIAEVVVEGSSFPTAFLRNILDQAHLIAPGRVYNTVRAQEARSTLQRVYRDNGFPFEFPVALRTEPVPAADGGEPQLRVIYSVTEDLPVREISFVGNTVVETAQLEEAFARLLRDGVFSLDAYQQAEAAVARLYTEAGYRGSGVDDQRSTLVDGVLTVYLQELRIASLDTTAIGVDPSELSLRPGDLFNYDVLLQDIKRLAEGRSRDVRIETLVTRGGDVRVIFQVGPPDTAGPIRTVEIEGNTVIPSEELTPLLSLSVGDTFTSALAAEDFRRIADAYRARGYFLATQPNFNYLDGRYVQRLTELRIERYEVIFETPDARTRPGVITRYLPEVGSVYNDNALLAGLRNVARLGPVQPVTRELLPGESPDALVVRVVVRESQARTFTPELVYDTASGLSASISYSDANLWGEAHNLSAQLTAQTSDIGFLVGGAVSYDIPWLDIDLWDFREVQTSVSASLFSLVSTNQPLSANGQSRILYPGLPDLPQNRVLVGEYTVRDTGLSFSVGRPVLPFTTLRVAVRGSYSSYRLEPPARRCEFDEDGNVISRECSLPQELAAPYLPQSGLSSFITTGLTYDDRDSVEFPRTGLAATGRIGLGFGSDYRNPQGEQQNYLYTQLEFGVKTYLTLARVFPDIDDPNHVLAFKLNVGHQFGGDYPVNRYFQVGDTPNEATQIRGYRRGDFNPSQTYAVGSIEYRYDFGLETVATQTIIGIVFVDIGYASSVPGFEPYRTPLFAGIGAGLQFNLGFGGLLLPPIRLDYGFSQRNPGGVLSFRLGPVF